MKQRVIGIGCGVAMILVLMDGKTAQAGVRQGLTLCGRSVLPALLPFFVLSKILTVSLWGRSSYFGRLFGQLFRMPEGSECLLIPAFLGGFPTGAAAVGEAWKTEGLKSEDAEHLLGWCSNAGPSFLFGICGAALPGRFTSWYLWGLLILGALAAARLIPGKPAAAVVQKKGKRQDLMGQTVTTMCKICVTVILFRVIICYFDAYVPLCDNWKIYVEGLLELTNGCCDLPLLPEKCRLAAAGVFLSLGGLCVLFQTYAVTSGLSLKWYFVGKAIQASVCLLGIWKPMALILGIILIVTAKLLVAFLKNRLYNSKNIPIRRRLCFSERK